MGIYIHWPFCAKKCPYCDFNVHIRKLFAEKDIFFSSLILDELRWWLENFCHGMRIASIHFGGGSPSIIDSDVLLKLMDGMKDMISPISDNSKLEIGIELNPSDCSKEKIEMLHLTGFNRISIGVQSVRQDKLSFLNRQHTAIESRASISTVLEKFENVSCDLMYCTVLDSLATWEEELREITSISGLKHVSAYPLTIEKGTKFYFDNLKSRLTTEEDLSSDLCSVTRNALQHAGFEQYEISNYAKKNFESRHNLRYWQYLSYIGLGPGAHGRIIDKNGAVRCTKNFRHPNKWSSAISEVGHGAEENEILGKKEVAREALLMGLRLINGCFLDRQDLNYNLLKGTNFEKVEELIADGVLSLEKNYLKLNKDFTYLCDHVSNLIIA